MAVISVIGPKGGIGKTTLSINTASALTNALESKSPDNRVCLVDLDLRLPTIASLLDSHPAKTFYDLFETLENKTYQVDILRVLYQIITWFQVYLEGEIKVREKNLLKCFSLFKSLNTENFHFANFPFGDQLHALFLHRGKMNNPSDLKLIAEEILAFDLKKIKTLLNERENNSRPNADHYVNYIEEYGLSIIGGEVPILGKRNHRRRINDPEFLVLFLDFMDEVFDRFDHVILDTPAGGVNHLSSIMNAIDQVLFIFDLSNSIAINGSIDALHSFIDYYEDFQQAFQKGQLTGLDKAYADRLVTNYGREAVEKSLQGKKLGVVFNRFQGKKEIDQCLDQMREYLDILDKLDQYGGRIHIMGMVPHTKIINITNNRGVLFYAKDGDLSCKMDLIAYNVISQNTDCPTLHNSNQEILEYLHKNRRASMVRKLSRLADKLQVNVPYGREKTERSFNQGLSIP